MRIVHPPLLVVPAIVLLALLTVSLPVADAAAIPAFTQTNLVSSVSGLAATTDGDLKNPWGVTFAATGPFWVADNMTGVSTLYNGAGIKQPAQPLVVTIVDGKPTGIVFNPTTAFNGDLFIFATLNGSIQGWRGALGTTAELLFPSPLSGAVYTGLALGTSGNSTYLYAANFPSALIDVFPSAGAPGLVGSFTDATIPSGFAPYNIQNLAGKLYVTYAKIGSGDGYVDVFNLDGTFVKRLASSGPLNSPWGITIAPNGFGALGGDFLIGNFGDGTINAFTDAGDFVGTLADAQGDPLVNSGLWALTFGNNGNATNPGSLYFTAGINDETDGLFARIDAPVSEPGTLALTLVGLGLLRRWRRRLRT